ncbi:DISARM system SNF2-like helicase DrmD [Oxynema aestuarii]|nr:DISARM system SNF2-like helicase DrmD [Oxynema aestuarii]
MIASKPSPRHSDTQIPRVGMLATVRNRRALVVSVEPFDGGIAGRLHLVGLEYTDMDGNREDKVIWERELNASLLEPTALPRVDAEPPMQGEEFDALQRAARWTALSPFLNSDRREPLEPLPFSAPLFGAVQVEDFQLVPLYKALRMPRISLLLADDVGLGKTVEAGLILTELLLRRRIRRVLILCPAALRKQWQQEMKAKFSLSFDVVDRAETHAIQKRLGLDANPWRTYPRIITSYHYLRQPDVLEQFRTTLRQPEGSANLPWDLLIVDEAHNLMPANFGDDSDLSKMLRFISPWFEHKLFLTATPHNGHTRCFSGLLEQLDPVRFMQTGEMDAAQQQRIEEVVIRRLKREINQLDENRGEMPRFCQRIPQPVPLFFGKAERQLGRAFSEFRTAVKAAIADSKKTDRLAGSFAVEVLNKRLLSCPYTFAQSWVRFQEGIAGVDEAEVSQVQAAKRAIAEDIDDDLETEGRIQYAAKTTGAWLKPLVPDLTAEIAALDSALQALGLVEGGQLADPVEDERFSRLLTAIKQYLRNGKEWIPEERLVVFTEYKTTLDYLDRRLKAEFPGEPEAIRVLYGGMSDRDRDGIKQAFNDPADPIRILVATDAASEGLNLQETAHLILHYDIPWNPARLDQRNGRLDRHGQARDVIVFHFTSDDDADLKFLAHVVQKVNTIREELGSMGEVFDAAFQRRFIDFEDSDRVVRGLDEAVEKQRGRATVPRSPHTDTGSDCAIALQEFEKELDLTPETLKSTLEIAMGLGVGLPRFEGPDTEGKLRLQVPIPPKWEPLVDDYLRLETNGDRGALPAIVFDPSHFIQYRNNRPVFRAAKDTALLHLGHPIFYHALALFARARFPGGIDNLPVSRWTVRYGEVPDNADALLLLTVEELAVNELRESFHHWVRTLRFPIVGEELGEQLSHVAPVVKDYRDRLPDEAAIETAQELWDAIAFDLREKVQQIAQQLTEQLHPILKTQKAAGLEEAKKRFESRIKEVERAMKETTLQKLEKERERLLAEMERNPYLFPDLQREQAEKLQNLEDELKRRRHQYQGLLDFLKKEQNRTVKHLIPKRHTLRGTAQVFPVTVEIRLPEVSR